MDYCGKCRKKISKGYTVRTKYIYEYFCGIKCSKDKLGSDRFKKLKNYGKVHHFDNNSTD